MTLFKPCIDLHDGKVKQIVGGTLTDQGDGLQTNFESEKSPAWFSELYQQDKLLGGHIIKLGPGNDEAARTALAAYPGGMQLGGGITADNASHWLEQGAREVIVTSSIFDEQAHLDTKKLERLVRETGSERLVLDLSCRRVEDSWVIAMNRWQTLTDVKLSHDTLDFFADSCCEFLIHAADVEGLCRGIDEELVRFLGTWGKLPVTYAGGAQALSDLERVNELSEGKVDLAIGSALDLFGGTRIQYKDCVAFNHRDA